LIEKRHVFQLKWMAFVHPLIMRQWSADQQQTVVTHAAVAIITRVSAFIPSTSITRLCATGLLDSGVILSWDPVYDATKYKVWCSRFYFLKFVTVSN
jgi:hypothetical protein